MRRSANLHLLELILVPFVHSDGPDERDVDTEAYLSAEATQSSDHTYLGGHQSIRDR